MAQSASSVNADRPVKATYLLVTVGSKTARGGVVATSSTGAEIDGRGIACVGDLVRYPDGTESPIASGAGYAAVWDGKPLAIVGSHIANGDVIADSLQGDVKIIEYADDEPTPGLLEVGYKPPTPPEA